MGSRLTEFLSLLPPKNVNGAQVVTVNGGYAKCDGAGENAFSAEDVTSGDLGLEVILLAGPGNGVWATSNRFSHLMFVSDSRLSNCPMNPKFGEMKAFFFFMNS